MKLPRIKITKKGIMLQWYKKGGFKVGTNYYLVKNKPTVSTTLHIGKSSAGWRFLFYMPRTWEVENKQINTFKQWQQYLKEKTESKECVIMDEYDEEISFDDFIALVERKQKENHKDMFSNCYDIDGFRFSQDDFC